MSTIPEGFALLPSTSPFHELVGPLYAKREGSRISIGMIVQDKHRNRHGSVHGGMIAMLADFAMGQAASLAEDPPRKVVTISLGVDFAGNAKPGDWVEAQVDVYRPGKRVAFVNCFVARGTERIGHASGTFLIMRATE
jgi:uncharacterized protein (TIGR00369 family)